LSARRDRLLFELVHLRFDLRHLGSVVVDHRVDDPVHQGHRAFFEDVRVQVAHLLQLLDAARVTVVHGHEIVGAEEEIDVTRGELVLARMEVDAVKNDVEVPVVRLDLRMMDFRERVFD